MFHLNLLRSRHLGLCRLIRCLVVHISMAFTSRTLLCSDLSAKKTEQKKSVSFELEVRRSIKAAAIVCEMLM